MPNKIPIEIAYCSEKTQVLLPLEVLFGTTIQEAIALLDPSQVKILPDISTLNGQVGIFGQIVPLDTVLKASDRIEIYRTLIRDPKEARRQRVREERIREARIRQNKNRSKNKN